MAMIDMREGGTDGGQTARGRLSAAPDKLTPRRSRKRFGWGTPGDRRLIVALTAVVAVSLVPALMPSPFLAEAPIQTVSTLGAPSPVEVVALPAPSVPMIDPNPVGALGTVRGTVDEVPEPQSGMQIIEVPKPTVPLGPIRVSDPSDMRQPLKVAHLPDRELLDTDGVPTITNGRRPLDVYAGHWSGRRGNRIAIVVGGLGLSQSGTQEAIQKLPKSVTLAISPNGNSLERWARAARRKGHELLLQVPMQAFGRGEPDPRERRLELELSEGENVERLLGSLSRFTNYVGVMNYQGGAFQAQDGALTPVMREVRDRGLLYVDDGSNAQSRAGPVARGMAAPFAGADIVLDLDKSADAIKDQLARLEETARGTGRAIAVANAYDESVDAIAEWAKSVEAKGFELVPVSALADDPGRR